MRIQVEEYVASLWIMLWYVLSARVRKHWVCFLLYHSWRICGHRAKDDAADQQYLDFNESIIGLIWTRRFGENDPVRAWGSDSGTWNGKGNQIDGWFLGLGFFTPGLCEWGCKFAFSFLATQICTLIHQTWSQKSQTKSSRRFPSYLFAHRIDLSVGGDRTSSVRLSMAWKTEQGWKLIQPTRTCSVGDQSITHVHNISRAGSHPSSQDPRSEIFFDGHRF